MKKLYPYLAVCLAMLFWSSSFIAMKYIYASNIGPLTMTFLRLFISSFLMPGLYFLLPQRDRIKKEHLLSFALLAFFEPFIYFIGESNGMQYVPASYGAVIISLIPLITPLFAWIFIKEKLTRWGIIGALISFAGVVVLVFQKENDLATFKGIAFLAMAVAGAVAYGIQLRRISSDYKPVTIVLMQTWFGTVYFLPVFLIFEGPFFFAKLPPVQAFYPIIGLAVFCTCGAFLLFTSAIKKIGLFNANVFTNLIPVFTVVLAYFFIHESVSLKKISGILIVVAGLFLSQLPVLKNKFIINKAL